MSKKLRINKIYGLPETWKRFDIATGEIGWSKKKFIQQITHAYFGKNRDYYADCAILDAAARGMDESAYYTALYDGGGTDHTKNKLLSPYLSAGCPVFEPNPLSTLPKVPTTDENTKNFNIIDVSDYYFVLLQVGQIVDGGPMSQLISRMLENHFFIFWERSYAHQIRLHERKRFKA